MRHMERALLGLLEDFHLGKLKAFGKNETPATVGNCWMDILLIESIRFHRFRLHNGPNDRHSGAAGEPRQAAL